MESLGKSPSVFSVELMTDYMSAIVALVAVTGLLTEGLLFVLKQPTDLPMIKQNQSPIFSDGVWSFASLWG